MLEGAWGRRRDLRAPRRAVERLGFHGLRSVGVDVGGSMDPSLPVSTGLLEDDLLCHRHRARRWSNSSRSKETTMGKGKGEPKPKAKAKDETENRDKAGQNAKDQDLKDISANGGSPGKVELGRHVAWRPVVEQLIADLQLPLLTSSVLPRAWNGRWPAAACADTTRALAAHVQARAPRVLYHGALTALERTARSQRLGPPIVGSICSLFAAYASFIARDVQRHLASAATRGHRAARSWLLCTPLRENAIYCVSQGRPQRGAWQSPGFRAVCLRVASSLLDVLSPQLHNVRPRRALGAPGDRCACRGSAVGSNTCTVCVEIRMVIESIPGPLARKFDQFHFFCSHGVKIMFVAPRTGWLFSQRGL